jgi:EmrB/QacA subfamily drug resistance transporter
MTMTANAPGATDNSTANGIAAAEMSSRGLRRLTGLVMLGALMMQLDLTMTTIATKTLVRDFHTTLNTMQWVGTGYGLAMAATIPLAGWALERFGARAVWMTCIGAFLAGSVLCGMAWSADSLIAFRVLQGLGAGAVLPVGQAALAQAAGPRRLSRVMAMMGLPALVGPVLGPVIGGVLVSDLSWRWIFYVNVPVCLSALALSLRAMPSAKAPGRTKLDLLGLTLLSSGCAVIVYGLAETGMYGSFASPHVFVPLVAGAVLVAAFAVNALRASRVALIDLRLLGTRSFGSASASIFADALVMFGVMGVLPLYYQVAKGYSPQHAGLLLMPMGIAMALTLTAAGRLTSRLAPRTIALAGLACAAAGTTLFTQITATTGAGVLSAAQVLTGVGLGALLLPIMTAAYQGVRREAIPRATSGIRIMQQLGGSFGGAALYIIVQRQLTEHPHTAAGLTAAFGGTFWWVLAFIAVMLAPVLFLPGRRPGKQR